MYSAAPRPKGPRAPAPIDSPAWYEAQERIAPSYVPEQVGTTVDAMPEAQVRLPAAMRLSYQSLEPPPDGTGQAVTSIPNHWDLDGAVRAPPPPSTTRFKMSSRFQSYPAPEMGASHSKTVRGSAFMHKGFFDIMQLANDRKVTEHMQIGRGVAESPNGASKLRATMGRAAGAFRHRDKDLVFAGEGHDSAALMAPLAPSHDQGKRRSMYDMILPRIAPGTKATKKRISVDMISPPREGTFVHAAHASDEDEAQELLNRWSLDGIGKVAEPGWYQAIREALRLQAERTQAEAIAQVQAALHQESRFREQPRPVLHVINGAPTPSTLTVASSVPALGARSDSARTVTTLATLGHSHFSGPSGVVEEPESLNRRAEAPKIHETAAIAEEEQFSGDTVVQRATPLTLQGRRRPELLPRKNTADTIFVAPSPLTSPNPDGGAGFILPDYMQYRTAEADSGTVQGLPGANVNGMLSQAGQVRPLSMVVKGVDQTPQPPEDGPLRLSQLSVPLGHLNVPAFRPSLTTVEKSVAAKIYFENLYYGILKKPAARETRRVGMEKELAALRISDDTKEEIRQAWVARETEHLREVRDRVSASSFVKLKTIGHGAFGVVSLVKEKHTGRLYAMKQLRKADMLSKGQEGHVRAERDLMTSANASGSRQWIINLIYSFQDTDHLYLIMEFMGGGDLLNLLIERDIFQEDFARFYVAEMILAIHEAHKLGYIHRDIKPDNFLFSSKGHIKLADFGLCQSFHWAHDGAYYDQQRKNMLKKHGIDLDDAGGATGRLGRFRGNLGPSQKHEGGNLDKAELSEVMSDRNPDGTPLTHVLTFRDKNKRKIAYSVVGTNNYMAPEVLRGLGYDQSCDWWSLGVIVFEMLYGYPPFVSKSRHLTRSKIVNWKQTLKFPPKPKVSPEARDFISRLLCDREDRLGSTSLASTSRPNSLIQGSRQSGHFSAAHFTSSTKVSSAGLTDGVEELLSHSWFRGLNLSTLASQNPPFKPSLAHAADTRHFEDDIAPEPLPAPNATPGVVKSPMEVSRDPMLRDKDHGDRLLEMRKQLAFVGYTWKGFPDMGWGRLGGGGGGGGGGEGPDVTDGPPSKAARLSKILIGQSNECL